MKAGLSRVTGESRVLTDNEFGSQPMIDQRSTPELIAFRKVPLLSVDAARSCGLLRLTESASQQRYLGGKAPILTLGEKPPISTLGGKPLDSPPS